MLEPWQILVVDDEEDIHLVTQLALKLKSWRNRGFRITSAHSAADARKLLASFPGVTPFHVALVDVVMETPTAGLGLCEHIRDTQSRSLRIVLRTGQPGVAPPERVLRDYDIDFYVEKQELTQDKLFSIVRTCLRSSQDISTLMAFSRQLQDFTRALQSVTAFEDLAILMNHGLRFLETKHSVSLQLIPDVDGVLSSGTPNEIVTPKLCSGVAEHVARADGKKTIDGEVLGLPAGAFAVTFTSQPDGKRGILSVVPAGGFAEKDRTEFMNDALLFLENWQIAVQALDSKERIHREQLLREKMNLERMRGMAHAVAGVAHQLNTPLGVATTAVSILPQLAQRLAKEVGQEIADDLSEAAALIERGLNTAHSAIKKFKQLSVNNLYDIRLSLNLRETVNDFVTMNFARVKKAGLAFRVVYSIGEDAVWDGYPGHLTRILTQLLDNVLLHAYTNADAEEKAVELTVDRCTSAGMQCYRLTMRDFGRGIPAELRSIVFEPFAAGPQASFNPNRPAESGAGLGLAICRSIVTDLLRGRIWLTAGPGPGTTVVVEVPQSVPEYVDPG
jgi:signal transduction histidine kinase/DNA-binding response OmpR family regulator